MNFLSKSFFLTVFAVLSFQQSYSRVYSTCPYPQHEVGVGYGYLSTEQIAIGFSSVIASGILKPIAGIEMKNETYSFIGPVSLNYKFFFKERLSVGASLLYSYNKLNYEETNGFKSSMTFHALTILPRFDFYYIRNPKFALYGSLAAGGLVLMNNNGDRHEGIDDVGAAFAFQVTPIAMRIGRDFGFVLELGVGSHGLANGGVSYRHYDRPWGFNK